MRASPRHATTAPSGSSSGPSARSRGARTAGTHTSNSPFAPASTSRRQSCGCSHASTNGSRWVPNVLRSEFAVAEPALADSLATLEPRSLVLTDSEQLRLTTAGRDVRERVQTARSTISTSSCRAGNRSGTPRSRGSSTSSPTRTRARSRCPRRPADVRAAHTRAVGELAAARKGGPALLDTPDHRASSRDIREH